MTTKQTYTTPWCELEFVIEEDSFLSQVSSLDPLIDDTETIDWD